jgi:outer membrane protein
MNKKFTVGCLVAALGFLTASSAQAEVKIGLVDMNKIFSSYYKTKDAENRINDAAASAKKELDDRMETYQKNLADLNKLNGEISRPELSKDAKEKKTKERDEKIAETKNLEREISEFRNTRGQQLQEQKLRRRNEIVEEIQKLIDERVKTAQYDLVLDKSGNSANGVPVILFSKEANDFSDEIIEALNKNKPNEAAPASSPAAPKKK